MPEPELKPLSAGDPITQSWIANLVKLVLRSLKITVAPPLKLVRGPEGVVITMPPVQKLTIFELTEALSPGSDCKGKRQCRNNAGDALVDESGAPEEDLYDDIGDLVGNIGDRAWCVWWQGRWSILRVQCS